MITNISSSTDPFVSFVASNGVVLATENKHKSILYEEHSVHKVEMITKHIGMIYSGEYKILDLRGNQSLKVSDDGVLYCVESFLWTLSII
jgi:20S proteasome subunit alpha 2